MLHKLPIPSAEHAADFLEFFRQSDVFSVVEGFRLPQHEQEDFCRVKFPDCQFHVRQFFRLASETRDTNGFNAVNEQAVYSQAEREAVRFRDCPIIFKPRQIGALQLLEHWQQLRGGLLEKYGRNFVRA